MSRTLEVRKNSASYSSVYPNYSLYDPNMHFKNTFSVDNTCYSLYKGIIQYIFSDSQFKDYILQTRHAISQFNHQIEHIPVPRNMFLLIILPKPKFFYLSYLVGHFKCLINWFCCYDYVTESRDMRILYE